MNRKHFAMLVREKGTQMSVFDLTGEGQTAEAIAKYPLPQPYVRWAVAIAKWIDVTVPCVASGEQSEAVTDMVIAHLRRRGVSDMVISEALSKSDYKYPSTSLITSSLAMLVRMHDKGTGSLGHSGNAPDTPYPSMGVAAQPSYPEKDIWQARDLDQKFAGASIAGSRGAMDKIARALKDVLDKYGKGAGGKERNEAAAEEILRNVPHIRPLIRVVGPEPPVPGPDGRTPRRVGPNTYVLDEDALERAEAEAGGEGEGEGEAD